MARAGMTPVILLMSMMEASSVFVVAVNVSPKSVAKWSSLTALEQLATNAWPTSHHAAISLPDAKKR